MNSRITNLLIMSLLNKDITQAQRESISNALNSDKCKMELAFRSLDRKDQVAVLKTFDFLTKKVDIQKGDQK
ncbi:MAG: hypothetical protein N2489_09200 [Clostridia bacterium]|nr:hypothetical protein [Clostridia bacterium]